MFVPFNISPIVTLGLFREVKFEEFSIDDCATTRSKVSVLNKEAMLRIPRNIKRVDLIT